MYYGYGSSTGGTMKVKPKKAKKTKRLKKAKEG